MRLLLWIHLHEVKNESNYLAKLAQAIDYSEGSLKSHLLPDLLQRDLIESLNPDKVSPPYKTTNEAEKLLEPIFFVRKMGYLFIFFISAMSAALLSFYIYNPALLILWWLPLTALGFGLLIGALLLYPQILLKLGKKALPGSR